MHNNNKLFIKFNVSKNSKPSIDLHLFVLVYTFFCGPTTTFIFLSLSLFAQTDLYLCVYLFLLSVFTSRYITRAGELKRQPDKMLPNFLIRYLNFKNKKKIAPTNTLTKNSRKPTNTNLDRFGNSPRFVYWPTRTGWRCLPSLIFEDLSNTKPSRSQKSPQSHNVIGCIEVRVIRSPQLLRHVCVCVWVQISTGPMDVWPWKIRI